MLKIGIITPFSNEFPFMARNFVRGIKLAFGTNEDIQFLHVETERGIPNEVSPLLRQLVINDEVNLLVGFLESSIIPPAKEFLAQTQVPFIVSGMGVRLPLASAENIPNVFYNSFRMWESCWLSGTHAASAFGPGVGVLCSFFDAGYPLTYAHTKGAEAGGASPVFLAVTHKDKNEDELQRALRLIRESSADYYFASYYGKERAFIFNWLNQAGINSNKLVASPGIYPDGEMPLTVTSWHTDLDTTENREFIDMYNKRYASLPDEFAMLGYENGLWISQACPDTAAGLSAKAIAEGLRKARFTGPRGEVSINAQTQSASSNHLLVTADEQTDKKQFKQLNYPAREIEQEIESNQPTNLMGWQNTYLCK